MTDTSYTTPAPTPPITLDDVGLVLGLIRHTMKPKQAAHVVHQLKRWAGDELPANVVQLRGDAERRQRRSALLYFADRIGG